MTLKRNFEKVFTDIFYTLIHTFYRFKNMYHARFYVMYNSTAVVLHVFVIIIIKKKLLFQKNTLCSIGKNSKQIWNESVNK